jgi:hypothetical protein
MIMTRRRVLTAAGCITGAGIVAGLMRSQAGGVKSTITTLFWVGEPSDSDNGFIPNDVSYWDHQWQLSFGGVDDPEHRNGYWPADFKPRRIPSMSRYPSASLNRRVAMSLGWMLATFLGTAQGFDPS